MENRKITRRQAITTASVGALGTLAHFPLTSFSSNYAKKLAINGGKKVRNSAWPEWPVWETSAENDVVTILNPNRNPKNWVQ